MRYTEYLERSEFSQLELLGLSQGNLVEDAPEEFIRLPAPPMLMVDRVVELERTGARGRIVGEQDIHVNDWFFHFTYFRNCPISASRTNGLIYIALPPQSWPAIQTAMSKIWNLDPDPGSDRPSQPGRNRDLSSSW